VAGPSNRPDRDESDSDSVSDGGSSGEGETPARRRPPTIEGLHLKFWYPLHTTIKCPHDRSSAQSRVKLWTSAKQSVSRCIRDLHE